MAPTDSTSGSNEASIINNSGEVHGNYNGSIIYGDVIDEYSRWRGDKLILRGMKPKQSSEPEILVDVDAWMNPRANCPSDTLENISGIVIKIFNRENKNLLKLAKGFATDVMKNHRYISAVRVSLKVEKPSTAAVPSTDCWGVEIFREEKKVSN